MSGASPDALSFVTPTLHALSAAIHEPDSRREGIIASPIPGGSSRAFRSGLEVANRCPRQRPLRPVPEQKQTVCLRPASDVLGQCLSSDQNRTFNVTVENRFLMISGSLACRHLHFPAMNLGDGCWVTRFLHSGSAWEASQVRTSALCQ